MDNMQELLVKAQELMILMPIYIEMACEVIGAIAITATAIVKVTPSTKDDKAVGKVVEKIWDLIDWLPTIGVNPRTKKLREAQKSLKP